jgi:5'-3' exonuclease
LRRLPGSASTIVPGWGAKSASTVLAQYEYLEAVPEDPSRWGLGSGRALRLAESLKAHHEEVPLYRRLATLRHDVPLHEQIAGLEWHDAHDRLKLLCSELDSEKFPERVRLERLLTSASTSK